MTSVTSQLQYGVACILNLQLHISLYFAQNPRHRVPFAIRILLGLKAQAINKTESNKINKDTIITYNINNPKQCDMHLLHFKDKLYFVLPHHG